MLDVLTTTSFAVHNGKGIYALLLGSGISRAANIPTGWEVTLDLIARVAASMNETEVCKGDPESWYQSRFSSDTSYSDLLERLAISPAERTTMLARYFEKPDADGNPPQPTDAHVAIAKMVRRGYFRVILTTNFDRLMERALEAEGVSPIVLSTSDAIHGAMPLAHAPCTIIKLHGDYRELRLRNTVAELSDYDARTRELLDRVLDEYGLIVSGWSATWDIALRDAISRAPNRRFTTVWTYVGSVSAEAEHLITLRQAQRLDVVSADSFFSELNEKLLALEEFDRPHPVSIEMAVALAKRYVAEDRDRIRLSDLVMSEVDTVLESALSLSTQAPITTELYLARIQLYETLTRRLLHVIANTSFWGTEKTINLLCVVVERLMSLASVQGGVTLWINLQLYPAALAFYATGVALIGGGNYQGYRRLVREFHTRLGHYTNISVPAFERLQLSRIVDKDALNAAIGKIQHLPASERVHGILSKIFAQRLPFAGSFDDAFDRFELLCSLVLMDLKQNDGHGCGWFGRWLYREELYDRSAPTLLKQERDRLALDWPPLVTGVFSSAARFDEVFERHQTDCVSRTSFYSR